MRAGTLVRPRRRAPGGPRHRLSVTIGSATARESFFVVVDDLLRAQEGHRPEACREPRLTAGREHVVGPGEVVAEADRRVRAEEDRPGVRQEVEHLPRLGGLHFEVLGAVGVAECSGDRQGIDEHDGGLLPGERRTDAVDVGRLGRLPLDLGRDSQRQIGRIGDQHGCRELVVLGLAHQVGGHEHGVRRRVGDHQDLGRTGLRIDAGDAAHEALRRRDVDVPRPRDEIDRVEVEIGHSVGERADGSRPTHRVDLFDTEQSGGAEDDRMHRAVVRRLRRRCERDRRDTGDLGGHDVHHDAGRVDRLAPGT